MSNIIVIANPRSGSQEADKFIKKYGTGVAHQYNVLKTHQGGYFDCRVTVYDVTIQKMNIFEEIRQCLESMNSTGIINIGQNEEQSEIILAVMGGDGSLGCFIDDLAQDDYIS